MKYKLKVGVSSTPAGVITPRLAPELERALPEVAVSFEISDSFGVRDQVLSGRVELGMVGLHFQREDLHCTSFLEGDRLVVIVPPGRAHGRSFSLRQLKQEPFIGRRPGSGTRATYEPVLAAAGTPLSSLRLVREEATTEACIEAVARDEGISIVSGLVAQEAVEAGRVIALDLETVTLVRNLYLIRRAGMKQSEAAERFQELLLELCKRCHRSAAAIRTHVAAEVLRRGAAWERKPPPV